MAENAPSRVGEPRYIPDMDRDQAAASIPTGSRIVLVINDQHTLHYVRENGYLESPSRVDSISAELAHTDLFVRVAPRQFGENHIKAVHDGPLVEYFKRVCTDLGPGESIYPYVFPIRNAAYPPTDLTLRGGYYCFDTFTPVNRNAIIAARGAVDCALTAAQQLPEGHRVAYALVRPPGHHAERGHFGGFCYFNTVAIAAQYVSQYGKVAILDVDYHHGNGQQDVFYERSDVLTISIHGHPSFAYPYFSGFADEKGIGAGEGCNINIPLGEHVDGECYQESLAVAVNQLVTFQPRFLIVALGLDTAEGDPTGTWTLQTGDFQGIGETIGSLHLPTLVVQEGGYDTRVLGINARHFFEGLWRGYGVG